MTSVAFDVKLVFTVPFLDNRLFYKVQHFSEVWLFQVCFECAFSHRARATTLRSRNIL